MHVVKPGDYATTCVRRAGADQINRVRRPQIARASPLAEQLLDLTRLTDQPAGSWFSVDQRIAYITYVACTVSHSRNTSK